MLKLVSQEEEVFEYRKYIVSYIAKREIQQKAFTCWLCYFDDNREDYYVPLTKKEEPKKEEPKAQE